MKLFQRLAAAAFLAALTLLLAGCGGGSSTSAVATGRAVFNVTWPERTRLIPAAANSLRITIKDGSATLAERVLARPDTSATFESLPVRDLTATAISYASNDGTGTPLSTGNIPVTVQAGQTVSETLTMASTVDRIEVDYTGTSLLAGETATVTATAYDASNSVVLVAPSALQWASSDAAKVSVAANNDGTATLTGVGAGNVSVTVTDTESNKVREFGALGMTFTLSSASETLSVNDTHQFTATVAGPSDTSVTWSLVDAQGNAAPASAGSVSNTGLYTAPATAFAAGAYRVKVVANGETSRVMYATLTVRAGSASVTIQ